MRNHKSETEARPATNAEGGFTVIEVAVASIITVVGLIFLASLFVLAIGQNRHAKQATAATMIAQQKLEEINAVEKNDPRLTIGGGLDEASKQTGYCDQVLVHDSGTVTTVIPSGEVPNYARYWKIEADPTLDRTAIISVGAA